MAIRPRPRPGQTARTLNLFRLLGLGGLVLSAGLGARPAWSDVVPDNNPGTSLGTIFSCIESSCNVTGGKQSSNNLNLFHRFQEFDTSSGPPSSASIINFDARGSTNVIVGVTDPLGTFINRPISGGGANLIWLSPGGIIINGAGSFTGVANLTLSTATHLSMGSGEFFTYNTTTADAAADLTGTPDASLNGLSCIPGPCSPSGILVASDPGFSLSVSGSLLLEASGGVIEFSGIETNLGSAEVAASGVVVNPSGPVRIQQSSIKAGTGGITVTGNFSPSSSDDAVVITDSDLTAAGGNVTISNNSTRGQDGSSGVRIENSGISATADGSIGGSVSIDAIGGGYFGGGSRYGLSIIDSTINAAFIDLSGEGGVNTSNGDAVGVDINKSTLTASSDLTIFGIGGDNSLNGSGVRINASTLSGGAGIDAISIDGSGADSSDGDSFGTHIISSQINAGGTITIFGDGGFLASKSGIGVYIDGSTLTSNIDLIIDGAGGDNSLVGSGVQINASTLNGGAGIDAISIFGSGADSSLDDSFGSRIINSLISAEGEITLKGTGGSGASGSSTGLRILGGEVNASGSGGLSLTGTGGSSIGTLDSQGVYIGASAKFSTVTGTLQVTGTGGSSNSGNTDGVRLEGVSLRTASDRGTLGSIAITGTGGTSTTNGFGDGIAIFDAAAGSTLSTEGGNIILNGRGGPVGESWGIFISDSTGSSVTFESTSFFGSSSSRSRLEFIGRAGSGAVGIDVSGSQASGFGEIDFTAVDGSLSIKDSTIANGSAPGESGTISMRAGEFLSSTSGPSSTFTFTQPLSVTGSRLSTFPANSTNGNGAGGTITLEGGTINISTSTLTTSGTLTGGTITVGNKATPPSSTTIASSSLVADPPATGGIIDIYGNTINISNSTLNLVGSSGGALTIENQGSIASIDLDDQTTILVSSDAPINITSVGGSVTNNATVIRGSGGSGGSGGGTNEGGGGTGGSGGGTDGGGDTTDGGGGGSNGGVIETPSTSTTTESETTAVNPPPPDPTPNPTPQVDPPPSPEEEALRNPATRVLVRETLNQDPLASNPQTSTQRQQTPGPLTSATADPQAPATLALALNQSDLGGDPGASPASGAAPPEGTPAPERSAVNLGSTEAAQNFDSGNAEVQQDTARKLGLGDDAEQATPPSQADLQQSLQAVTAWMRSRALTSSRQPQP